MGLGRWLYYFKITRVAKVPKALKSQVVGRIDPLPNPTPAEFFNTPVIKAKSAGNAQKLHLTHSSTELARIWP